MYVIIMFEFERNLKKIVYLIVEIYSPANIIFRPIATIVDLTMKKY